MSKTEIRIFAIDDHDSATLDVLERVFKYTDFEAKITMRRPSKDVNVYPFCDNFPSSKEFDNYDYAFVDIELNDNPYSKKAPLTYHPDDYEGGTVVLPKIREDAPWLPVIGYSRLYDVEGKGKYNPLFLISASTHSFDVQIPRNIFGSNEFDHHWVELILNRATNNRLKACIGREINIIANEPELELSEELRERLYKRFPGDFESLLKKVFYFSKRIVIEPFTEGYSGSAVLKVFSQMNSDISEESTWIIKLNSSPSKLHKEIRAHQLMSQKGIPFALTVPTLFPNVIYSNNVALIGYHFALGYEPFSKYCINNKTFLDTLKAIESNIKTFYSTKSLHRELVIKLLKTQLDNSTIYSTASSYLSGSRIHKMLQDVKNNSYHKALDESILVEKCLIHGDLHCDNVMVNHSNNMCIFIDFAHSKIGESVYDVAKFYVDVISRIKEYQIDEEITWPPAPALNPLMDAICLAFNYDKNNKQQLALLNIYIFLLMITYLEYNIDKGNNLETWLLNVIPKQDPHKSILSNLEPV